MKRNVLVKLTVSLLIAALLAAVSAFGALAAVTATTEIYTDDYTVAPGETSVSVPVKYRNNNVTAEAGLIRIGFDNTELTYVSAADNMSASEFSATESSGVITVAFAGADVSAATGTMFTLNFSVPSDYAGDTALSITVDNFGSTSGMTVTEYAGDVTTSGGRVHADFTSLVSDGSDMPAKIAAALAAAATDDVTITLNGTWTFTADTVFGSVSNIPSHTVTISGGTIQSGGYMPSFCGNFIFTGVNFVGSKTGGTTRIDAKNGMYFPEGCSCVIGTGCSGSTGGTTGFNLAGDFVEVNSGSFYCVAAQMLSNAHSVAINNPKITVQGTASVYIVCGLGYNTANITGKGDLNIGGSANVPGFLVAGGYYSNSSALGGTLTVNTTGNSTIRVASAAVGSSGTYVASASAAPKYEMTFGSTAALTLTYGATGFVFNGDSSLTQYAYLDCDITFNSGVTVPNQFFLTASPAVGGGSNFFFLLGGKTKATFNGGSYMAVWGGARINAPGAVVATDTELYINGGTFGSLLGAGSYFHTTAYAAADGSTPEKIATHSGNMEIHYNGWTSSSNNKFGGSIIYAQNAKQTGTVTAYVGDPSKPTIAFGNVLYTAGAISAAGAEITGKSTVIVENARFSSNMVGGAWILTQSGVMRADSELIIKSGSMSSANADGTGVAGGIMTGGCYATGMSGVPTDTDPNDHVYGGFGQVGNVYVTVENGVGHLRCRKALTGYGVNVDGSSTIKLEGGTYDEYNSGGTYYRISFLSDKAPDGTDFNNCSITGDLKIYIGGTANVQAGAIRIGETSTSYPPKSGYGVVGGNCYWEVYGSANFSSNGKIYVNGNSQVYGDCYLKIVGSSYNLSNAAQFIGVNNWGATYAVNSSNKKYLDLSLCDEANPSKYARFVSGTYVGITGNSSDFTAIYPALIDASSISVTGATYGADPLSTSTVSAEFNRSVYLYSPNAINSYTRTWADIEKWDAYAENKTADAFELKYKSGDAYDGGKKFTTDIDAEVCGNVYDVALSGNPNIAAVTTDTLANFDYLGVSIRLADNGLRARGYVTDALRGKATATDGYKVKSYGVLVSKSVSDTLILGTTGVKAAIAYDADGSVDKYFLENGKYTFAAMITNIPDANLDTPLRFRPYVELVDEEGDVLMIYADLSTVQNFKASNGNNIEASFKDVARYHATNETAFYIDNKAKIDAILA